MSRRLTVERRAALEYRVAEFVAYAAERMLSDHPNADAGEVMRAILRSSRYEQLADFDTYIYTYTFDELYQMFEEELLESGEQLF